MKSGMLFGFMGLVSLGLTSCSQAIDQTKEIDPNVITEYIVDFKDDVSAQQIVDLEKRTGLEFKPNSAMFSKTKMTHVLMNAASKDATDDLLEDSGIISSIEPVFTYSLIENVIDKADEDAAYAMCTINESYVLCSNQSNDTRTGQYIDAHMVSDSEDEDDNFKAPNDPLYRDGKQWNMTMIGVEKAWTKTKGKGAVVAVLDTGISTGAGKYPRVPDLAKTCMKEGYDFVDDTKDAYDWHGHGTHVGGTIAQSTNNGIGVVGIAHQACLMPVKVLDDNGSGRTDDIAEAIIWATDHGANVINMSLGGGGFSQVLANAVKYAAEHDVFVACAAGNSGRPVIEYPAAMDGCHAISSVGKSGNLAFYSSYGKNGNGIFVAAPGGDKQKDGDEGGIWQDTIIEGQPNKHGYFPFQGTSMATPHVAGVAALVYAKLGPDKAKLEDVEEILTDSATPKKEPEKYGKGLLNAEKAVIKADGKTDSSSSSWKYLGILAAALFSIGFSLRSRT